MPKPQRTWLELQAAFIAARCRPYFWHPVVATLIGTFLTFAGHNILLLRSIGLFLVVVWLSVDLWIWLLHKKVGNKNLLLWQTGKFAIGWTGTSLLLIIAACAMWWGLNDHLGDQQDDTSNHLTAVVSIPPDGNPSGSIFTITNGGHSDIPIQDLHCRLNFLNYGDGRIVFTPGDVWITSPHIPPLSAGGDGRSDVCLGEINIPYPLTCADVTLKFDYRIASQPSLTATKLFRFVAHNWSGHYAWYPQPVASQRSECETPDTEVGDTSNYAKIAACPSGCDYPDLQAAVSSAKCGTIIFYDAREVFDPLHPANINHPPCDKNHWIIVTASSNPSMDAMLAKGTLQEH
jgi:hypothetical protein